MLPFVGVDGEGGNVESGDGFTTHTYTMLRAGDQYVTSDWFRFLATLPKKRIHVAYFFDYDVTMMCRGLPDEVMQGLACGQEVEYGKYLLFYRPRKEFTVKAFGRKTVINDVGTFFQSSFVKALERWDIGTVEQRELIASGKTQRANFGQLRADTIKYNAMECRLLEALMEKFRQACYVLGYLPRTWQGPGQLAKAMLAKHHIPKTDDLPEIPVVGVWDAAQAAYYGGRFETTAVGPIQGPIEGWDINSAYPHAISTLPCLMHCEWRPSRVIRTTGLYKVTFSHPEHNLWNGLPFRRPNGTIHYPTHGTGWYWGVELLAAQAVGARYRLHYGFEWIQHCDHQPFHFMPRLYAVRKAMGKTEAGMALKLAMNSVYGVLAQSVGKAPYANPIWAGLITARTRAQLLSAISQSPADVFMAATDGIYARPGLDLVDTDELGGWSRSIYPYLHIVQPGVYFAGDGAPKTRGVPYSAIIRHRDELIKAYTGNPEDSFTVPLRQFIGLRLAMSRGRPEIAGQWIDTTKRISYDWSNKRKAGIIRRSPDGDRTVPYTGDPDDISTPYDRLIGGNRDRENERLEFADAPDWADTLEVM